MIVIGVGMFAVVSYMPTYLQMVYGVTATHSDWLLLPMVVGLVGASLQIEPDRPLQDLSDRRFARHRCHGPDALHS